MTLITVWSKEKWTGAWHLLRAYAERGFANLLTFVAWLYVHKGYPFSSTDAKM